MASLLAVSPLEVFEAEEKALLLSGPTTGYDLPTYGEPKVIPTTTSRWSGLCTRSRVT